MPQLLAWQRHAQIVIGNAMAGGSHFKTQVTPMVNVSFLYLQPFFFYHRPTEYLRWLTGWALNCLASGEHYPHPPLLAPPLLCLYFHHLVSSERQDVQLQQRSCT